jgi:hypothetical protein
MTISVAKLTKNVKSGQIFRRAKVLGDHAKSKQVCTKRSLISML